ncbi:MAG: DUF1043 family protein [Gammaproteobacteria bacterium]|nr:DUF1043 family protein [Gammaproteobacteria bacterium]
MQGDTSAIIWFAQAGVFIVALIAGLFFAKGKKSTPASDLNTRRIKRDMNDTKTHYKNYRDSVHSEFKGLNSSIKEMNKAYDELYEHLANGGVKLSLSSSELKNLMKQDSDFIDRLPQIKASSKV